MRGKSVFLLGPQQVTSGAGDKGGMRWKAWLWRLASPGPSRGTGPVFAAFLVPHILAGLTAISSGALVMVSRKGTERHVRAGTAYFWAITVLAATAAGLTAIRVPAAAGGGC